MARRGGTSRPTARLQPPPPLAPPPLIDGTVAAAAIALFVLLAVVAVRFSRRVALQRSLAQRALRKRAERDAQRERAADAGLDWSGLLRWAAPLNPQTPPEAVVELSATALLAAMEARQLSASISPRPSPSPSPSPSPGPSPEPGPRPSPSPSHTRRASSARST